MQYNMYEAKTHFSSLISHAESGDEVVIARSGKPIIRLVPIKPAQKKRKPGSAAGQIEIKGDFNEPLPHDVLATFYS